MKLRNKTDLIEPAVRCDDLILLILHNNTYIYV